MLPAPNPIQFTSCSTAQSLLAGKNQRRRIMPQQFQAENAKQEQNTYLSQNIAASVLSAWFRIMISSAGIDEEMLGLLPVRSESWPMGSPRIYANQTKSENNKTRELSLHDPGCQVVPTEVVGVLLPTQGEVATEGLTFGFGSWILRELLQSEHGFWCLGARCVRGRDLGEKF